MDAEAFAVLIPIALFAMIFLIVKSVADNKTRQKAIEKGVSDEFLKNLFKQQPDEGAQDLNRSLKWGMVAFAIGLGLMTVDGQNLSPDDPSAFGIPLLYAGVALVLYQMFLRNDAKKSRKDKYDAK
jgi:hypothetical protein